MQLNDLLLHDSDKKQLLALLASGTQSILFDSDRGFGKRTIALSFADEMVGHRTEYINVVEPLESTITIDQVRKLKSFFTLKTLATHDKRVAVIVDADSMTAEAQNSLLKLLEEPPSNCYLVLTSSHTEVLLPTIRSRVQEIHLRSVPHDRLVEYFKLKGYPSMAIEKATAVTSGLAGVTSSILSGEDSTFVASLDKAKEILGQKHLERLKNVDLLAKDRQSVYLMLDALKTISVAALNKNASNTNLWKRVLKSSSTAQMQLMVNASTKLVLTNLFLSI